jgi:hypothetical protein
VRWARDHRPCRFRHALTPPGARTAPGSAEAGRARRFDPVASAPWRVDRSATGLVPTIAAEADIVTNSARRLPPTERFPSRADAAASRTTPLAPTRSTPRKGPLPAPPDPTAAPKNGCRAPETADEMNPPSPRTATALAGDGEGKTEPPRWATKLPLTTDPSRTTRPPWPNLNPRRDRRFSNHLDRPPTTHAQEATWTRKATDALRRLRVAEYNTRLVRARRQ